MRSGWTFDAARRTDGVGVGMKGGRSAVRRATQDVGQEIAALARETAGLPADAVEIIRYRLKMAARLIERAAGRVGPVAYGSSWPPIMREWADLLAQEEAQAGERDREQPRIHFQPTARQVTQAEEALSWRRYVADPNLDILNIWLRCQAHRRPWQRSAQEAGYTRETAKRRLDRCFFQIAIGLNRDGLPIVDVDR